MYEDPIIRRIALGDEAVDRLIKEFEEYIPEKYVTTNRTEEGHKKLKEYVARFGK